MIKQIPKASRDHAQRYQKLDIDFYCLKELLPPTQALFFVDFWKQKEVKTEYKNCKVELTVMATLYTKN